MSQPHKVIIININVQSGYVTATQGLLLLVLTYRQYIAVSQAFFVNNNIHTICISILGFIPCNKQAINIIIIIMILQTNDYTDGVTKSGVYNVNRMKNSRCNSH